MYETMMVWETDPNLAGQSPLMRDFAQVQGQGIITHEISANGLKQLGIVAGEQHNTVL